MADIIGIYPYSNYKYSACVREVDDEHTTGHEYEYRAIRNEHDRDSLLWVPKMTRSLFYQLD